MAALTRATEVFTRPTIIATYKVAGSTTIYKGALVGTNANGYAVPMDHAVANLTFIGVAEETMQNTGADGDKFVRICKSGSGIFADVGSATQASIGKEVYAKNDNEVQTGTGGLTNQYKVGTIVALESTAMATAGVRVRFDRYTN